MAKKNYYNIANALATNAQYIMLLGERSNGKSYQVKKTALEDAYYDDNAKLVYLRRYDKDIKEDYVTSYFEDMPVSKITSGDFDRVLAKRGFIYFVKMEDGEVIDKKLIGRYCGLNIYERYKSQVFKGYKHIIYEEFITDAVYLDDEPRLLQQFVSTVARLETMRVFLVGNTLSRVCPYFHEWCLEGVLRQKEGTIEVYHYHTNDGGIVDVAVERCASAKNTNTMFFGQAAQQITTGEWDVKEVPKLPRKQYEYDKVYEVKVVYQAFEFVLELLVEPKNGGKIIFVYPLTTKRDIYRVITDEFSDLPNVTCKFDIDKKPEAMIVKCLRLNKICYSDNLTGADFSKCIDRLCAI